MSGEINRTPEEEAEIANVRANVRLANDFVLEISKRIRDRPVQDQYEIFRSIAFKSTWIMHYVRMTPEQRKQFENEFAPSGANRHRSGSAGTKKE